MLRVVTQEEIKRARIKFEAQGIEDFTDKDIEMAFLLKEIFEKYNLDIKNKDDVELFTDKLMEKIEENRQRDRYGRRIDM